MLHVSAPTVEAILSGSVSSVFWRSLIKNPRWKSVSKRQKRKEMPPLRAAYTVGIEHLVQDCTEVITVRHWNNNFSDTDGRESLNRLMNWGIYGRSDQVERTGRQRQKWPYSHFSQSRDKFEHSQMNDKKTYKLKKLYKKKINSSTNIRSGI